MFFNVPVSSSALTWPAPKLAVSARPIIRSCFLCVLPPVDGFRDACINRAGIECNFRPSYDPGTAPMTRIVSASPARTPATTWLPQAPTPLRPLVSHPPPGGVECARTFPQTPEQARHDGQRFL